MRRGSCLPPTKNFKVLEDFLHLRSNTRYGVEENKCTDWHNLQFYVSKTISIWSNIDWVKENELIGTTCKLVNLKRRLINFILNSVKKERLSKPQRVEWYNLQVDETLNWNIKCKCIIANVNFEGLSNHSAQVDEYEYEFLWGRKKRQTWKHFSDKWWNLIMAESTKIYQVLINGAPRMEEEEGEVGVP